MTASVPVLLNGEPARVPGDSVLAVLRAQGLDPEQRGIAVAVDDGVVPRAAWADTPVREGARIEVIRPVQGG